MVERREQAHWWTALAAYWLLAFVGSGAGVTWLRSVSRTQVLTLTYFYIRIQVRSKVEYPILIETNIMIDFGSKLITVMT